MNDLSMAKARESLTSLPEMLADEQRVVAVTRRGKPVLAIMDWEFYDSLLETLEIMNDPDLMKSLRKSIRQLQEGKTIPWETVKAELNL